MEIHPKFSHWLSLAKISPPDETIRKWWTALDGFNPTREDLVKLVSHARLFDAKATVDSRFLRTIQQVDAAFLGTHKMALAVLATIKLHVVIEADDLPIANLATLLVAVAFPACETQPPFRKDLSVLAESVIDAWSHNRADWSLVQSPTNPECELDDLRRVVAVSAEETNILWWLFGEESRDLGASFASLPAQALGLISAKELADLTTLLPGPVGIKAFLAHVLKRGSLKATEKTLVAQSVKALPKQWKDSFGTQWELVPARMHCRVANAITGSASVSSAKWPSTFAALTGWPQEHKIAAVTLANLFYRECLVMRAWRQAGS